MLITLISELSEFIPVTKSFDLNRFSGAMDRATSEVLLKIFDSATYNSLEQKYTDKTFGAIEKKTVTKAQAVIAHFAYAECVPTLMIQTSGTALHIISNENQKTPFDHQVKALQETHLNAGHAAVDQLYQYLVENKNSFTTWRDSDNYPAYSRAFISSVKDFNETVDINNSYRNLTALRSLINEADDFIVLPVIGSNFREELLDQIHGEALTRENIRAVTLIRKAIAHYASAEAMLRLTVKLETNGYTVITYMSDAVVKKKGANDILAARSEKHKQLSANYIDELRKLLYSNNSDDYRTFKDDTTVYVTPDNSNPTQFPNSADNSFYFSG